MSFTSRLLTRWVVNTLALFAAVYVVAELLGGQVSLTGLTATIIAALILGIVNATIRPILLLVTFPLTIVTLGLFIFVVNTISILLVATVVPGFWVSGFWSAFVLALVFSLMSWVINTVLADRR